MSATQERPLDERLQTAASRYERGELNTLLIQAACEVRYLRSDNRKLRERLAAAGIDPKGGE
jgi:vancomycin permeability regulator SanA